MFTGVFIDYNFHGAPFASFRFTDVMNKINCDIILPAARAAITEFHNFINKYMQDLNLV